MIYLFHIYLISVILSLVGSIYEWNTEEDHKGWSKKQYFLACFIPISNTTYSISMFLYIFKWLNKPKSKI